MVILPEHLRPWYEPYSVLRAVLRAAWESCPPESESAAETMGKNLAALRSAQAAEEFGELIQGLLDDAE